MPISPLAPASRLSVDPHTIVEELGQEPYGMYAISRSDFSETLHRKTCIYVKAIDNKTGEIVGYAGWSFRGLDPQLIPWVGPGDAKPEAEERDRAREKTDWPEGEKADGGGMGGYSIDRLHALEDADMQYWLSSLVPADSPCMFVRDLIVSLAYHSRGVGSAVMRHGNAIADDLGLTVWVHSSHLAYEAYKKFGLETMREPDIEIDEYAPRAPRDDEIRGVVNGGGILFGT
ncbi:hypothetical protein GGR53DRAFT_510973 [Hypoxylon sp. FL1150]|nr:hypothetical protein GGR53DRAFT_510973 [Hypoxylon sp. FL1150]